MSNANCISMTCSSQQNISFPHFIVVTFDSCYVQGGRLIEVKITKRKDKHNTATGWPPNCASNKYSTCMSKISGH